MKQYKLLNIKTNKIENVYDVNVFTYLYNFSHTLPQLPSEELKDLKQSISRIEGSVPLYDPYSDYLYIIIQSDLYNYIVNKNYRFPTTKLIDQLKNTIKENKNIITTLQYDDTDIEYKISLKQINKNYKFIIDFMDYFDNDILLDTYIKSLYNTNELGKSITLCKKKSFHPLLKHIKPYYTQDEIIKMALDMNLITPEQIITNDELRELCKKVSINDISYENLISHHKHIAKNKMISLIKYYTFNGSERFNTYLRMVPISNIQYDNIINEISNLILTVPKINKKITVYRYIREDSFISNLKIGETFIERGFLSTSRNSKSIFPGKILFEIHVPENYPFLCIETFSEFAEEEEIIFAPNTCLKLISKNFNKNISNPNYSDNRYKLRYIFDIEKYNPNIKSIQKEEDKTIIPLIDFNKIKYNVETFTFEEKIQNFIYDIKLNIFEQFYSMIGKNKYLLEIRHYDSTNSYKTKYAFSLSNGYIIYGFYKNQIVFSLEFSRVFIVVNFNIFNISTENIKTINEKDFVEFICSVEKYFNINVAYIYPNVISCDYISNVNSDEDYNIKQVKIGGTYCEDIYDYIKYGIKKYNNIKNVKSNFLYELLDYLKNIKVESFITKYNKYNSINPLYHLYENIYKPFNKDKLNAKDFYLWLVEKNCYYVDEFINQTYNIPVFEADNPFYENRYIVSI